METLSKIFHGAARVKVMRLFLFNPDTHFSFEQIINKAKISKKEAKSELDILHKAKMIKSRIINQRFEVKRRKKIFTIKKKITGWYLDKSFEYLSPLKNLLINIRPLRKEEILRRLSSVGKLKMVLVAGVFIQNSDSRVDLLIVGDNLKRSSINRIVKVMEAEIGKELIFASFETSDFQYRLGVYDKLVRDILDYPHQKLLDRLNLRLS